MRFREWLGLQEALLNEDYKTAVEKFSRDNPETDREAIQKYVDDFRKIANKKYKQMFDDIPGVEVPKDKRNNVDAYQTFRELEALVDHVRRQAPVTSAKGLKEIDVDAKPVHEDDDLVVYYADSPRACVKYRGGLPYSWCIARSDSGNLFNSYRFGPSEPAFYFVKNKKRAKEELDRWGSDKEIFKGTFHDPWHFFVVQVVKNADASDQKSRQYRVTSANNDSDRDESWEDVVQHEPLLEGLQGLFKPAPLTDEEKSDYKRFSKGVSDEEFAKLTYEEKSRYLDISVGRGRDLTDDQFARLPEDLKNKYIGFSRGLSDEQYKSIVGTKLLKRYRDATLEKARRIMSGEADNMDLDEDGNAQADWDSAVSLNNSEIDVVKDELDYKSMDVQSLGRLFGSYVTEVEIEDDDEGTRTEGGWDFSRKPPNSASELLDRYARAKGNLSDWELTVVRKMHPSQSKAIEMHGDREIRRDAFEELLEKNFLGIGKGLREEGVKRIFERKKQQILAKDRIDMDDLKVVLRYSEDQKETIDRLPREALKDLDGHLKWICSKALGPEGTKHLALRLLENLDSLAPHPLYLLYAPDLDAALDKIGGERALQSMKGNDIHETFFGEYQGMIAPGTKPDRMQKFVELVFGNIKNPLWWMTLAVAKKCPDPAAALRAASRNPALFGGRADPEETKRLVAYVKGLGDDELLQAIAEANVRAMGEHGMDHKELAVLMNLVAPAADKGSLIRAMGPTRLRFLYERRPVFVGDIVKSMPKEQLEAASEVIEKANANLFHTAQVAMKGALGHVNSTADDKLDMRHVYLIDQDPNMTPDERAKAADDILRRKPEFRISGDESTLCTLIRQSSDRAWALRTVLSKVRDGVNSSFLYGLEKGMGAPFPGKEMQSAIEIIISFKDRLRLGYRETAMIFEAAPDKDRTASLIGLDRLKEIAKTTLYGDDDWYRAAVAEWLAEKGHTVAGPEKNPTVPK